MTFGTRLQKVLDEKGMNRADLCRLTGLKSANLVPYMKPGSERSPKLSTAVLIANALDVSLDYLAEREDEETKPKVEMDPDSAALLRDYSQCTPERRRTIAALTRDLRDQSKEPAADSPSHEEMTA